MRISFRNIQNRRFQKAAGSRKAEWSTHSYAAAGYGYHRNEKKQREERLSYPILRVRLSKDLRHGGLDLRVVLVIEADADGFLRAQGYFLIGSKANTIKIPAFLRMAEPSVSFWVFCMMPLPYVCVPMKEAFW